MKRLLVLLLFATTAHAGTFPVCNKAPQYSYVRVVDDFPPVHCLREQWKANAVVGAISTAGLLLFGMITPACTALAEGQNIAVIYYYLGDDSPGFNDGLGHELRHVFPPHYFHPYFVPGAVLSCEDSQSSVF